jgi:predicted DNA-binding transcriptional regulator AlpA
MSKLNTVSDTPSNSHSQAKRTPDSLPPSVRKFLRARNAADYLSISKSHFHALVRDEVLPKGKLVSGAVRVWKRAKLDQAAEQMWEGC